ncbi:MAG: C40 family peptidase [Ignavibacteriales bacterium]|nr:C40 family peptidase [Ignavibacteriales bacterium]
MNRIILPITIVLFVLVLFTGCSSTSSYVRYGLGKEGNSRKSSVVTDTSAASSFRSQQIADESSEETDEAEPVATQRYDFASTFNEAARKSTAGLHANFADAVDGMKMAIVKYDQTPYQYGGNDLDGIDCSGFTLNVYAQAFNEKLPRSAREQFQVGETISSRDDLKFGDLVFFNTRRRVRPGHVGIYIGDNKFVHASSSYGVKISSLDEDYYNRKYMGARRVLQIEPLEAGR